jgi:hypothetical protein
MGNSRSSVQSWNDAFDLIEAQLTAVERLSGDESTVRDAVWMPTHELGTLPPQCLPRAQALLARHKEVIGQLQVSARTVHRDLSFLHATARSTRTSADPTFYDASL